MLQRSCLQGGLFQSLDRKLDLSAGQVSSVTRLKEIFFIKNPNKKSATKRSDFHTHTLNKTQGFHRREGLCAAPHTACQRDVSIIQCQRITLAWWEACLYTQRLFPSIVHYLTEIHLTGGHLSSVSKCPPALRTESLFQEKSSLAQQFYFHLLESYLTTIPAWLVPCPQAG